MSPRALDPDATFDLVLASDQEKPEDEQPTFVFRYLATRDWIRVAQVADKVDALGAQGLDILLTEIGECAALALVGWRHLTDRATGEEIPFEPERLADLLTGRELMELCVRVSAAIMTPAEAPAPPDDETGEAEETEEGADG